MLTIYSPNKATGSILKAESMTYTFTVTNITFGSCSKIVGFEMYSRRSKHYEEVYGILHNV